jgi:hypothetical protein
MHTVFASWLTRLAEKQLARERMTSILKYVSHKTQARVFLALVDATRTSRQTRQ